MSNPQDHNEKINLHHGSGGEHTTQLLNEVIFKHLNNPILNVRHDGAFLDIQGKLAFSTDSYDSSYFLQRRKHWGISRKRNC